MFPRCSKCAPHAWHGLPCTGLRGGPSACDCPSSVPPDSYDDGRLEVVTPRAPGGQPMREARALVALRAAGGAP